MVATRATRGKEYPEPELTPTKTRRRVTTSKWSHTPSTITLIWLFISLPLVAWDTGYVLLRPLSMPGGSLHWPLWQPYELYGKVDYIYGWKAFNEKNGFTAAQGTLNIVESLMYIYALYITYTYGKQTTAQKGAKAGFLGPRQVEGKHGVLALLVLYSAAVMTVSKTVLYWMNEYYSGFDNIGHNSIIELLVLWIIPNGAWLVLPSYIIYLTGGEIVQGLSSAAGAGTSSETALFKADDTKVL